MIERTLAILWGIGTFLVPVLYWKFLGRDEILQAKLSGDMKKAREELGFIFLIFGLWPLLLSLLAVLLIINMHCMEALEDYIDVRLEKIWIPIADKLISWLLPASQ